MAYNGSGTFVINSAGQPVVTGTVISSTAFNALTADLATGLSTAITKDGQTTTTARIVFAQGVSSTLVTDATSATTGSIITAGGISTQKALWVGTTSRLVGNVQADGLVGIGLTPTNKLEVAGYTRFVSGSYAASGTGVGLEIFYDSVSDSAISNSYNRNTSAWKPWTIATSATIFNISGSEAARIGSDGSFLVNSTTNGGGIGAKIVSYSSGTNGITSTVEGGAGEAAYDAHVTNTADKLIAFRYSGGAVGSITTNGGTTAYNTSSDYRLKENVQPMTGGLATVAALKPVTYDWISNGSAGEGFIAHELQAVIPAAVTGEKDAVDDKGEIAPQGVDFSKIVPHLVAAIQELTTRLAALESK